MASETAKRIVCKFTTDAKGNAGVPVSEFGCLPMHVHLSGIIDAELRAERKAAATAYLRGFNECREMAEKIAKESKGACVENRIWDACAKDIETQIRALAAPERDGGREAKNV